MSRSVMPSVEDVSYSTLSGCGWASDCGQMFQPPKCAATTCRSGTRRSRFVSRSGEEKSYRLSPMWNSTGSPRLAMAL